MKKAFTLIELIFSILIIGILAGIGISSFKQDYLHKDVEYILLKIKETHFQAMGFDGGTDDGCMILRVHNINQEQLDANVSNPYRVRSTIKEIKITNPNLTFNANNLLCFDSYGRPHNGNAYTTNTLNTNNIIHGFTDITLAFNNKNCIIRVYPLSGYGIIRCQ